MSRRLSTRTRRDTATQRTAPTAGGRERLIAAAVTLATQARSITTLGIREIAREAGLNPNTFYRHFATIDDLGLTVLAGVAHPLRAAVRAARHAAAHGRRGADRLEAVSTESVRCFYDFVERHPAALLIGVRELHGPSPVLRAAIKLMLADFTRDMVEDARELALLPRVDDAAVEELAGIITRELFLGSLDYLEAGPAERRALVTRAVKLIHILLRGGAQLQAG